jgi:hypothetical protein
MGRAGIFAKIDKRKREAVSIAIADEMYWDTPEGAIP